MIVGVGAGVVKFATMEVFAVSTTAQVEDDPLQPPDHPENVAPLFGVAVSVTEVPAANAEPSGVCVTTPGPTVVVEMLTPVPVIANVPLTLPVKLT